MLHNGNHFETILTELARASVVTNGNLNDVLHFITERAANALEVQRVSVWFLNEERNKLDCLLSFDSENNSFHQNEELSRTDYPKYFEAIKELRTIAAINAETDPRTRELRETYFRKHRITTTLDAPIFHQGKVVGVVCHEQCSSARVWYDLERSFAASIAALVSLALNASKKLEAEKRFYETNNLLQTIATQMSDNFSLVEPDPETGEFVFRYVNQSAANRYGYTSEEMLGKPASFFLAPGIKPQLDEQMKRALETGDSIVYETQTLHKDGSVLTIEVNLNPVQHEGRQMVALIGRDITERKAAEDARLEAQARRLQTQRLESLGLLAGKVAHDFNNLLVGILGNVNLALHNLSAADKIKRYLTNIETTAQIAADLCNQLLNYSGKQKLDFVPINLFELVEEMANLLEVSVPDDVSLEYKTDEQLELIFAEPTQIRQIILNLVLNAVDAVAEKKGAVRIQTDTTILTAEDLKFADFDVQAEDFVNLAENRICVCLTVTDNGVGMNDATRQRIFEPFFTTKKGGHGLGLAAIAGIVRAHRGAIRVTSEVGKGTTFQLFFPALEKSKL